MTKKRFASIEFPKACNEETRPFNIIDINTDSRLGSYANVEYLDVFEYQWVAIQNAQWYLDREWYIVDTQAGGCTIRKSKDPVGI